MGNDDKSVAKSWARMFKRPAYLTLRRVGDVLVSKARCPDHRGRPKWRAGEFAVEKYEPDGTEMKVGKG